MVEAMGLGPLWTTREALAHGAEPMGIEATPDPEVRARSIADLGWEALRADVASCVACDLCRTRTQTVFGIGAARPDWLIVGAAPGADEDAHGEAFVGPAGKLLDAMLTAVGLSRHRDVFLANALKCRPPDERDPSTEEAACCRPYLVRQIALLAPRMILAVGDVASAALLGGDVPLERLRGRRHAVTIGGREIPVVATWHPERLLRSPEDKAGAWADLCFARAIRDEPGPPTGQ